MAIQKELGIFLWDGRECEQQKPNYSEVISQV